MDTHPEPSIVGFCGCSRSGWTRFYAGFQGYETRVRQWDIQICCYGIPEVKGTDLFKYSGWDEATD